MERTWWWKFGVVVALLLLAVAYLIPTVLDDETPEWYSSLINKRLSLGLDLRGGIHLVLGVEVDKAVVDYVDRLTEEVDEYCEEEDLGCKKVSTLEDEPVLLVSFESAERLAGSKDKLKEWLGNMTEEPPPADRENTLAFRIRDDFADSRKQYAVLQAIETLRNRIDEMAVREALVAKQGENGILIQIPGVKDIERARKMIGQTAQLEFKIVDDAYTELGKYADELPPGWELKYESRRDENGGLLRVPYLDAAKDPDGKNIAAAREWLKEKIDGTHEVLFEEYEDTKKVETRLRSYVLIKKTMLTGDTITDARVSIDQQRNRPYVSLTFDRQGANTFAKVTGDHVQERLAIVLDNRVKSAPVIQQRIGGGSAMITLNDLASYNQLFQEAQDLAVVLRAGALPAPVRFEETRTVGPTLGKDSIEKGKMAVVVGFLLVVVFMVMYYKFSGLIADVALLLSLVFIFAVMAAFEASLTLPGLAGIALTLGMAVDANVIINERIREELRIGKTVKAAIAAGYDRAFWTIFDSNITTALAGFVLWTYGTGPVKGFAVTLLIGIASSMFTAIVVTRLISDAITQKRELETLSI
ncbi:MAG: protein translocase subunit SecD [Myxococcales bacterium]|nr:MAG: protein translocase subunit SecD [Myxococcales bacterium]